jgi:hypothetical protein
LNSEKTVSLQDNVDPDLLRTMKDGPYIEPSLAASRKQHANDAIPAIAPKWLKYDRQVCNSFSISDGLNQHMLAFFGLIINSLFKSIILYLSI